VGQIHNPETSALNQRRLRNIPEDGRIRVNCSGSLRSRIKNALFETTPIIHSACHVVSDHQSFVCLSRNWYRSFSQKADSHETQRNDAHLLQEAWINYPFVNPVFKFVFFKHVLVYTYIRYTTIYIYIYILYIEESESGTTRNYQVNFEEQETKIFCPKRGQPKLNDLKIRLSVPIQL
jgi:hypothetical protein